MTPKQALPVIQPNAAGIEIGTVTHYVAIGQQAQDVCNFGCYTEDALSHWLREQGITTIAMERQSSYEY